MMYAMNETNKQIILKAIQDKFGITKGNQFSLQELTKDSNSMRWMIGKRNNDVKWIVEQVREAVKRSMMFFIRQGSSKANLTILRRNKYPGIKKPSDFILFIRDHCPTGILVDDQLLHYTYAGVQADITQLVDQGYLIKMYHSSSSKNLLYFLFYNQFYQTGIVDGLVSPAFYLDICREYNQHKMKIGLELVLKENIKEKREVYSQDSNYDIPQFIILKKQWLLRNEKVNRGEVLPVKQTKSSLIGYDHFEQIEDERLKRLMDNVDNAKYRKRMVFYQRNRRYRKHVLSKLKENQNKCIKQRQKARKGLFSSDKISNKLKRQKQQQNVKLQEQPTIAEAIKTALDYFSREANY